MLNKKNEEIKNRFKENELVCEKVLNIFSLISNKTRFRILCLLKEADLCVNDIVYLIHVMVLTSKTITQCSDTNFG